MQNTRTRHSTTRSYAGLPPEERKARRRQQFMAAGQTLFGTIGYRRTTVRLLCREAELTDRYFYESFDSIEGLLVAVYEHLINALEQAILTALAGHAGDTLEARIARGLDAFFRQAEDPVLSRILWIEILGVSPGAEAVYNVTLRRFADLLFTLARALAPASPVTDVIARTACIGVIGAASETAKDWLLSGYQQPRATLVDAMMLIFRGLVGLARPEGTSA